jgi:hypothetical protein
MAETPRLQAKLLMRSGSATSNQYNREACTFSFCQLQPNNEPLDFTSRVVQFFYSTAEKLLLTIQLLHHDAPPGNAHASRGAPLPHKDSIAFTFR